MSSEHVLELDSSNFHEVIGSSDKPVVVDFWAPWCPPCHVMAPIFERVAAKYAGKAIFAKVNVDEAPDIADEHRIRAIPTLMIFVRGRRVERIEGVIPDQILEELVEKHLGSS